MASADGTPSAPEETPSTGRRWANRLSATTANAATTVNLQLPDYQLVNLSAGVDFENGLSLIAYVNNVFDENALLSFDRERGGRARLGYAVGQPRTMGVTVRKSF